MFMKEVLIIRSVSFQQLDKNLPAVKDLFPGHKISILTHEHGALLARKYRDVETVYIYPFREGFRYRNKASERGNCKTCRLHRERGRPARILRRFLYAGETPALPCQRFCNYLEINDKNFDAVIIPVANITGAGFFNVLKYSLSINARQRMICNVVSEIREIKPAAIRLTGLKNGIISALSMVLTGVMAVPLVLFLPLRLFLLRKEAKPR